MKLRSIYIIIMRVISTGEGVEAARCGRAGEWDGFGTVGRGKGIYVSTRSQEVTSGQPRTLSGWTAARVGGGGEHRETLRVGRDGSLFHVPALLTASDVTEPTTCIKTPR